MKYKVGMKVRGQNFTDGYSLWNGVKGKIILVEKYDNKPDGIRIGVEFEKELPPHGHGCGIVGTNKNSCRFFISPSTGTVDVDNDSIIKNLIVMNVEEMLKEVYDN